MKLFGYEISKPVENVDKNKPRRAEIEKRIIAEQMFRTKSDINTWKRAVERAESTTNPNRRDLIKLFNEDHNIDGHVCGIVEAIQNNIKSKDFAIVDSEGQELPEESLMLKKKWFYDLIDYIVDAKFWGYSLVEFEAIKGGSFTNVKLVPRENVVPQWRAVLKSTYISSKQQAVFFDDNPYKKWCLYIVNDRYPLGTFNKISPHVIGKKNMLIACWRHAEIFGSPFRTMKTDTKDRERRAYAETMLKNMGNAGWGVFDDEDEYNVHTGSSSDAYRVFVEPFNTSNKEISKTIASQTGVFDEKAYVGSSEVHERVFDQLVTAFICNVEFEINNQLLPLMNYHGIGFGDKEFRFIEDEKITLETKTNVISTLLPYYNIDAEFINRYLGVEVEVKETGNIENYFKRVDEIKAHKSIMSEVKNLYHGEDSK